jgi:galactose-1-phosphate uridylyltransferase
VNSKIAEATAATLRTLIAVIPPPRPQLSIVQLFQGGCFDYYLFFGNCLNLQCTFKHGHGKVMEARRIDGKIAKMKLALDKFVTANGHPS